ncbi:MAG: ScyD/ScyE family protein [Actinomycetota bacterium]|nr:ScyD/ScyE family protein [Actinomycetota bacterium]
MHNQRRFRFQVFLSLGLLTSLIVSLGPLASAAVTVEVVATGLNNPRGLDVAPNGDVYVAEAGKGGNGACLTGGDGAEQCLGATGSITAIENGNEEQHRVVTGLPSLAPEDGFAASGPSDVDFRGPRALVTIGLGADPTLRARLGQAGRELATVHTLTKRGAMTRLADIAPFEIAVNPDGDQPGALVDTNPNSVYYEGDGAVVADAGGNSLLHIAEDGKVSTLAVFPFKMVLAPDFLGLPPGTKIPMQPVPTSVTRGPDGAYYVGQLTGFPFPTGKARVFRVVPGEDPKVYARGFTHITDLEFGDDGKLYVLQLASRSLLDPDPGHGRLYRLDGGGVHTEIARGHLDFSLGLAIEENDIYVSDRSILPGGGRVLHIER